MDNLFLSIIPLLFLIAFGYALRRLHYFSNSDIQKFTSLVGDLLVPCVIFNTILHLEIHREHIALSIAFFCYLLLLLLLSWLFYRVLHLKRRFFVFHSCAFAFGLMGIPLFSTVFGQEHMEYLVALGVGHELFIALVYITGAKLMLKQETWGKRALLQNFTSPLFYMVSAALILNLTGWKDVLTATLLGSCLFATIAKIASITTVLTMIVVGYRLHFQDKQRLWESALYVLFRYMLSFGVGYTVKFLVLDRLVPPSPYFDYAFFTMLSQFGSTLLLMLVGKYCSHEDMEVASNAFVLNAIIGIALYVFFVYRISTST